MIYQVQQPIEENMENVCSILFLLVTLHNKKRFSW